MSWLSDFFGGGAADRAAAEAARMRAELQAREDKRQRNIKTGQKSIDDAFAQFNPGYFDNFRQTYQSNYMPQIADQFDRARDKLTAVLAGRGMLESTVGANAFGNIQKTRSDAESKVAGSAQDAANELRGRVANTKSNLFNLNLSAADPAAVGAQALASAGAIVSPSAYPDLGNIFASALQPIAMANRTDATSMNPSLPWNRFNAAPVDGRGTGLFKL